MIGYSQFTNLLKQFADNHKVGIRFISEFREQLPNLSTAEIEFPILFVEPVGADTKELTNTLDVNVYCLDRLRKDRKNTEDVLNDTLMILNQDLTRWLEDEVKVLESELPYPAQVYNNYLLDYTAGWSIRLSVDIERIGLCEIPLNN